ncbi:MAG: CO dehydrogenase/acetyl-CoA synthase complex subunit epsilon [Candidatus Bathyarchaeia archaeon]
MQKAEPWQKAEISGPIKALPITKPEIMAAMIGRARRPVVLIGNKALENDGFGIEFTIRLAKSIKIATVATAHTLSEFKKKGFQPTSWMSFMDIANRLSDPEWKGLDGMGNYDLVLFLGFDYYLQWTVLSSLKHFANHLKTVSIDSFYQPHANWSLVNFKIDEWKKFLSEVLSRLEKGKA